MTRGEGRSEVSVLAKFKRKIKGEIEKNNNKWKYFSNEIKNNEADKSKYSEKL